MSARYLNINIYKYLYYKWLTIFQKKLILDVWVGSKYPSDSLHALFLTAISINIKASCF